MTWLLTACAFLSGSLPFGLLIARAKGVDIRAHGSGNIGATNVWRVLGARPGLLCFALDVLKGVLPVLLGGLMLGTLADPNIDGPGAWRWLAVMVCPVLGHMFSPWVGFKGGKGVATGLGAMLAVAWVLTVPALLVLGVWGLTVKFTRMVGVASCVAAAALPIATLGWLSLGEALGWSDHAWTPWLIVTGLLAALVLVKHRGNLARAWAGTEPTLGGPPKQG